METPAGHHIMVTAVICICLPLAPAVDQFMDVLRLESLDPAPTPSKAHITEPVPEGEIYFRFLILHHLHNVAGNVTVY